jgi:DNA-binding response OmpR family regulator/signal transduction histidine kinase
MVNLDEHSLAVTKTAQILLMSLEADSSIMPSSTSLSEYNYEFHVYSNVKEVVKVLSNIRYDMLILDDALFEQQMEEVVKEFRRLFPSLPMILLSNDPDVAYRTSLMNVGIDAFLTKSTTSDQLHYQIRLLLNQYRQDRTLLQLNRKLHQLASMPRLFYNASDPQTLILQAIKVIRNTFRLRGVVVVLREQDGYHLYSGNEEIAQKNRLYETMLRPEVNDPFLWTVRSGITQMYTDITRNPHFQPIPILGNAKAATIIPLIHQNSVIGAMGIFVSAEEDLSQEDLIIYEQFGSQLSGALQNVYQHKAQSVNIRSSQHLVRAWQKFANLGTTGKVDEIGRVLCGLVEEVPGVGKAFAWLGSDDAVAEPFHHTLIDAQRGNIIDMLQQLNEQELINKLIEGFDDTFTPVLIQERAAQDPIFSFLFDLLQVQQLVIIPIADSIRFLGGVVAGVTNEQNFDIQSINLIENLAHTAGVVLERITLTNTIEEKNSRLEGILRSISEGIFFVDENNQIAFSNPQVAELTSITSPIINQDADLLLRNIAAATKDPVRTYAQLQAARKIAIERGEAAEEYPIVELALAKLDRDLSLEFLQIAGVDGKRNSWVGVMRAGSQSKSTSQLQDSLVASVSENFLMPYTHLRSLLASLSEQHGRFGYRERDNLLGQIRSGVDWVGRLWNNFAEIYKLETGGLILDRQPTDIDELVRRVLSNVSTGKMHQITLDSSQELPPVKVDEFRIEQAITAVVQRAIDISPARSEIAVRLEDNGDRVTIVVRDMGDPLSTDQLEEIFEPISGHNRSTNGNGGNGGNSGNGGGGSQDTDFGIYLAHELVHRHGGHMWAKSCADRGAEIAISLPALGAPKPVPVFIDDDSQYEIADEVDEPAPYADEPTPIAETSKPTSLPVPSRTPNLIMFVQGESDLAQTLLSNLEADYEVLVYDSGDEAVEDINLTHLDLIIIDTMLVDGDGIALCKRMRKHTEVPIILVADKVSDADKVQGLSIGADDYITLPISDEELLARVRVIFKRQYIPDRVSEPLSVADLYIDFGRREVFLANHPVDLTRIEYDLLHALVTNRGTVLTHRQLLERVWGPDYTSETHYLWVNISRLRKKLESGSRGTRYIHTQPGTGYFFDIL